MSYLLLVGWETVLVSLATFATATVFGRLGWGDGNLTKVVAFLVVAGVIVAAGILGFDAIMRLQKWLTIAMIVVTVLYIALTFDHIDLDAAGALPAGGTSAVVGATILVMTGFGVGWVNSAADYSRYLPRTASTRGVVFWPTFGGSLPVVILVAYGVLLCASDDKLSKAVALDPIGALTTLYYFNTSLLAGRRARPDRRAHHDPADLVPGALRARRDRRPGQRRGARHLLLRPDPAHPRAADAALGGRRDRRRADDPRHDLHRLGRRQLPHHLHGVPDHPRRADGRLVRGIFLADLLLRRRDYDERKLFDAGPGRLRRGHGSRWC